MRRLIPGTLAVAALGVAALMSAAPAAAQVARPQTAIQLGAGTSLVTEVQYRGRRHWNRGDRWHRRHGWRRDRGAAIGAGIATGLIVGGAIAASRAQADSAVEYCMSRFRSYDPASGTYLGYDGRRHPCP